MRYAHSGMTVSGLGCIQCQVIFSDPRGAPKTSALPASPARNTYPKVSSIPNARMREHPRIAIHPRVNRKHHPPN